ncbi:MAG TPA: hypothetical protein VF557_09325 [Jatrophihabitans sp.]
MVTRYLSKLGTAAIASGWVIIAGAGQPVRLAEGLRSPYTWVAEVGPDAAAITLAASLLWLVALWTAAVLGVTALALLPGRVGLHAHAMAAHLTPALLRRVLGAAAGTSILISPSAAFADSAASTAPGPIGVSASPTFAVAPSLPMDRPDKNSGPGGSTEPVNLPALGWPTDPVHPTDPAGSVDGDRAAPAASRSDPRPTPSGDHVRVRPGDSLWSIAAHRLGAAGSPARIQGEWPRWYALNRQLIGADPNLLRPGASLLAPQAMAPQATAPQATAPQAGE